LPIAGPMNVPPCRILTRAESDHSGS
jgi:hypothetical protein